MSNQGFVIIAHRGFSSRAPENTIAAFDLAVRHGFTNIELDVQLTVDGVPIILHDDTVDRITNGTGSVASLSAADIGQLDAGSWYDPKFKGEKIPILEAVLTRYKGTVHLHIELKSEQSDLAKVVQEALEKCDWLATSKEPFAVPGLTVTSKYLEQLAQSQKLLPHIAHHWLSWDISEEIIKTALDTRLQGLGIAPRFAKPELIAKAKHYGLTIRGLEVTEDDDISKLIKAGAEGTTTNWPDRAERMITL